MVVATNYPHIVINDRGTLSSRARVSSCVFRLQPIRQRVGMPNSSTSSFLTSAWARFTRRWPFTTTIPRR